MINTVDNTLFLGKEIIHLPVCGSTNDEMISLFRQRNISEGLIIITSDQTAGKGQRGNTWNSEPNKNLTFSICLRPTFLQVDRQFDLNVCISLAILDQLQKIQSGFQVKWPNDIYFFEKKICGILIQNFINKNQIDRAVVGVGLNVNQQNFNLPTPTSLRNIMEKQYDLEKLLEQLVHSIESRYIQLKQGGDEDMRNEYLNQLYWYGEDHIFRKESPFMGRIVGISKEGRLRIETKRGIESFAMKEVEFVE